MIVNRTAQTGSQAGSKWVPKVRRVHDTRADDFRPHWSTVALKTLDSEPHFSARNDTCDVPSSVGSGSNEQPIRWLGISREWPPLPLFQQIFSWRAAIQDTLGRGRARRESDLGRECHARRFHAECLRQRAGRPEASRAIHPRRSRRIRAAPHPGILLDGRATTRRDAARFRCAEGRSTRR